MRMNAVSSCIILTEHLRSSFTAPTTRQKIIRIRSTYIKPLRQLLHPGCLPLNKIQITLGILKSTVATKIVAGGVQANTITIKDAENYSTIAKIALGSLDAAQVAVLNKDTNSATAALDIAEKTILSLQSELTKKGVIK